MICESRLVNTILMESNVNSTPKEYLELGKTYDNGLLPPVDSATPASFKIPSTIKLLILVVTVGILISNSFDIFLFC